MPMFHFCAHFYTEIEHWTIKWVNAYFTGPKYTKIKKKNYPQIFQSGWTAVKYIKYIINYINCKIYNKYMIASTQITNTEVFAVIAAQVF